MNAQNNEVESTDLHEYLTEKMNARKDLVDRIPLFKLRMYLCWKLAGLSECSANRHVVDGVIIHLEGIHVLETEFSVNNLCVGEKFRNPTVADALKLDREKVRRYYPRIITDETVDALEEVLREDGLALVA